jgi:hypothetical protein
MATEDVPRPYPIPAAEEPAADAQAGYDIQPATRHWDGWENETAITKDVRILEQGAATMFTITEAKHSAPYGRIACK